MTVMRMRSVMSASSLGLVLVLGACGSSKSSSAPVTTVGAGAATATTTASDTTTTGGNGANRQAAQQAWRDCLTQHGLTLPAAGQGGAAGGRGGQGDGSGTTVAGQDPFATPGATSGDPQAGPQGGNGGFGGGALNGILTDPVNKVAVDACASLRPAFGPGNGGGGRQLPQVYLSCLSDNGVSVPTTVAGGPAVSIDQSDPAYVAASAKCASLLPARGQARTAYNSCLKDNGVNVPTTVAGGPPVSIDQNDPAYAAASAKCAPLLPQRGPGTTTTTTNG